MATFVLLHGAGDDSRSWRDVIPLLEAAGHEVVAPDLPVADPSAGLDAYTQAAVDAIGAREGVVLVAQSLSGFVAPLVAARVPVARIVLVNAMVPKPGETAGEWWTATDQNAARRAYDVEEGRDPDAPFDEVRTFLHDVPAERLAALAGEPEPPGQSDAPFADTWPLDAWPDVPTTAIVGAKDRCFPAAFQRRVLQERLGITPDEIDSGHVPSLSRPRELADLLLGYL
ncbi:alpha/beta fold hydrolase [Actinokineospora auranticolor]|uniref:Pimeloyl-ACP methyl ester carboxylesterase n=1 Tax=Actinokineospora auranticolor TaxID=155976 RepID=A0A2S6GQH9_9PSEU|nr:alpha/beta fold hydrolase [Actinokineospora auranticolor]PPK67450.1 pimeloyl-ACP methyl ester carboxylesterase [Actinokineospora auranticolor]